MSYSSILDGISQISCSYFETYNKK